MQAIQIGHKIKYVLILILVTFSECWVFSRDELKCPWCTIYIENNTDDTLKIIGKSNISDYPDEIFEILTGEKIYYNNDCYERKIEEGEDAIRDRLFYGNGVGSRLSQISIYRNDSLLVSWTGPAKEMGDSIHIFFNYSSWDSQLIENCETSVCFTIYETDFSEE